MTFDIFIDDDGFWGISDSKPLKKRLHLKPKQKFNATIKFNSLTFTNYVGRKNISLDSLGTKIKRSNEFAIRASVSDMRRLENPLESSTLTYSNVIDLIKN